jgi:hypothetical protein
MDNTAKAKALLSIVDEIYQGGKDLIGRDWTVLAKMTALAENGDVDGMVRYFKNCKKSTVGQRVRRTLERAGRKSLESEEVRFMAIVRQ